MHKASAILAAGAALVCCASAPAHAISRYNSTGLSCRAIHDILARQGAAILRYPSKRVPGLTLYDRYVRDEGQCFPHQISEGVTVPSRDGTCPVLHCIPEPDPCDFLGGGIRCDN